MQCLDDEERVTLRELVDAFGKRVEIVMRPESSLHQGADVVVGKLAHDDATHDARRTGGS